MKNLLSILVFCLFASQAQSQFFNIDSLKTKYWEIGWVASDILVGTFSADLAIGIAKNQAIGLRTSLTQDYFNNDYRSFYQGSNYIYRGGIFHKIYFPTRRNRKVTLRHGPSYSISEYYGQEEDWIEFNRFGNTQYRWGSIDFEDRNIELGYELMVGLQQSYNSIFYIEYYVGLRYMELVNTNSSKYNIGDLKAINDYRDGFLFDLYPNNTSIVLGFVMGFQKQP